MRSESGDNATINKLPRIYIALPVLNENELLPRFMECISRQTFRDFELFVCVNQPDEWWDDPEKAFICEENHRTLGYLKTIEGIRMTILDRSSRGNGWKGKKHGVGWARKTVMDAINASADDHDIIVSADADSTFSGNYFQSILTTFNRFPHATGTAIPYFHKPVEDELAYRAILRYEIYMRHYSLNIWRIGSPYTFTALGSAMACPVWAYRQAGGMTPKMSGEDFYFLQKLRKTGRLIFWNEEKVFPEARFSDRVYFGTGPAMIKGNRGDWSGYPIYRWQFFDEIKETCDLFPAFFRCTQSTRVTEFMKKIFREDDPFKPLRKNFQTEDKFIRACHEKFDGLRILQYLKYRQKEDPTEDERSLVDFLNHFYPGFNFFSQRQAEEFAEDAKSKGDDSMNVLHKSARNLFSFQDSPLETLEKIRLFLVKKEEEYQINSALS